MNSDFEKCLQQQTPRELPREWRSEILQQAQAAAATYPHSSEPSSFLSILHHQLTALLWPNPKAWAGLAAVWIVILALDSTISVSTVTMAKQNVSSASDWILTMREQERVLAEWNTAQSRQPAERPRKFQPGPRSERPGFTLVIV